MREAIKQFQEKRESSTGKVNMETVGYTIYLKFEEMQDCFANAEKYEAHIKSLSISERSYIPVLMKITGNLAKNINQIEFNTNKNKASIPPSGVRSFGE